MEAARRLRLVTEDPPERAYVVIATRLVRPGTARVVAECADLGPNVASSRADARILTRTEMQADRGLAQALADWDAGDDTLVVQDFAEMRRLLASDAPQQPTPLHAVQTAAAARNHPSALSR